MRPAHRKPAPPNHTPRKGRLAPYDRAAERQAIRHRNIDLEVAEGIIAIHNASVALSNNMLHAALRPDGMPEANPLNSVSA